MVSLSNLFLTGGISWVGIEEDSTFSEGFVSTFSEGFGSLFGSIFSKVFDSLFGSILSVGFNSLIFWVSWLGLV